MISLKRVLREFEIRPQSTADHENFVFDSYVPDGAGNLNRYYRRIELANLAGPTSRILKDEGVDLGSGEDPRAFLWRNSPCLYVQYYSREHGHLPRLYIENERRWISLIVPHRVSTGKNWTPFVRDGDLFFIHGFSPFRVLKARFVHEADNFMLLDVVAEHRFRLPKSHDGFCRYRGGSAALDIDGAITGFGHTNVARNRRTHNKDMVHRPFLFCYRPGESVDIFEPDLSEQMDRRIIDPTSFFRHDDTYLLVTCETERVWSVAPQKGRICLYEVEITGGRNEGGIGAGRRRIHRWTSGEASKIRRLLGPRG